MTEQNILDKWSEKLLDTGKRNNLISFKNSKSSTAEVLLPDCQKVFARCTSGAAIFDVFDPKEPNMRTTDMETSDTEASDPQAESAADEQTEKKEQSKKLSRSEYYDRYSHSIKAKNTLLIYAQGQDHVKVVRSIAKRAKAIEEGTGINVAHFAFGFVKWNEKETSNVFYYAPLLLVPIRVLTGSVTEGVKIAITDDDVIVNQAFDYLLRENYGFSLPQYQDGTALDEYFSEVTNSICKLGWDVVKECKMGVFSFLKLNMYEDLKRNASLVLENANIKALLSATPVNFGFGGDSGEGHVVKNPLIDLHTVVDADSSQIEAIEMAKSGKSFVLQGPPGTGKSQTITNIIAECLHDGKRILFVSEKQAALNVVYEKLRRAGLSDFCLELHSHKANKKEVIEELNRTMELPRSRVSSVAQDEIRQKEESQIKLDSYAYELHKARWPINLSLYQLFERYSAERHYPELQVRIQNIESKGQDYILQAVKLLEQYEGYVPSVGDNYRQNPWYGFNKPQLTFDERSQLENDLKLLTGSYKDLREKTGQIKTKYETPDLNYADTVRWQSLLEFSAKSDVITPALLSREAVTYVLPYIDNMEGLSKELISVRQKLFSDYDEDIVTGIDGMDVHTKLLGQFGGLFSRLFSAEYKNIVASMQIHHKMKTKPTYQAAVETTANLMKLQEAIGTFGELEKKVGGYLGKCYKGADTDWAHVKAEIYRLQGFFVEKARAFGSLSRMSHDEFEKMQNGFSEDAATLTDDIASISDVKKRVSTLFDPEVLDLDTDSYDYCIKKLSGCVTDFDKLGNWISYMSLLDQLDEAELSSYIDTVIENKTDTHDITGAYRRAFYRHWIEYVLFTVPELASFSRIKQDQAVQHFTAKDNLQYEISKLQIKSELSQKLPDLDMIAGGSSVALLRRERQKKRKQLPIRTLLSRAGELVQTIKPCFMMSPLSVSTFLDPEIIRFDTVIFDEASQVFPQDALGAIYRGSQLVVVGDSKQMPPSNFFNTSAIDDDDDEEDGADVADFESILDVCSTVFDTERLSWHYRSHYEQLIAFSNLNYYNNKLVTFPSTAKDRKGIGVDYFHVDGIFDRKSKTNRIEADFIVDLVYKHIEEHPDRSLGVIAFSVAQQNMIDLLLSKRREENPSYEWFFSEDRLEPFFVKNLETVQGDERDTIIFSVAYAKDSRGTFLHNFGPLNRAGGERRLNVAITRAKDNVQLVASIHYTDIKLDNAKSEGARLLRAYLDYAQNGEQALERIISVSGEDRFDSFFEEEVCEFLRDHGFEVDTQVGCSGYRIDLGIRRPASSDYVLAVECDGASYHSSKNARDRDSLRQRVLENMGWQFYRIWSTDWFRNKTIEKERLLKAARKALENDDPIEAKSVPTQELEDNYNSLEKQFVTEIQMPKFAFPEYKELDALRIVEQHGYYMQDAVHLILETEAPLSEEYLLKRIVPFFGREKVTKVVARDFDNRMFRCERKGIIRSNGFLYLQDMDEIKFRVPGVKRNIKYISTEELADGLYTLINQNISIEKDGLYKTLLNLLGIKRNGESSTLQLNRALALLERENKVVEKNGLLTVADGEDISL